MVTIGSTICKQQFEQTTIKKHIYYYDPNDNSSTEIKETVKETAIYNFDIDLWTDVKTQPLIENESGTRICFAMAGYSKFGNWTTNEKYSSSELKDKSINHVECSIKYNDIM